jgi:hypothetical protein
VSLGSISLITGEGDPTNLVTEFGQIDEYIPSNYLPGGLNSNLEILPEGLSCFSTSKNKVSSPNSTTFQFNVSNRKKKHMGEKLQSNSPYRTLVNVNNSNLQFTNTKRSSKASVESHFPQIQNPYHQLVAADLP